jgi:hypothetical protein
LCALVWLVLASPRASATLGDYTFEVSTGTSQSVSSGTTLWSGSPGSRWDNSVNNVVGSVDLPFSFRFDGTMYDRVSISSNGVIALGSNDVTSSSDNALTGYDTYPLIAPWWDQLTLTGGAQNRCSASPSISWAVNGTAPNRVFVVEYHDVEVSFQTAAFATFQVRLYEGSNAIEFFYPNLTSITCWGSWWNWTSATIGIAASSSDFMSVIPDYSSAYVDRSSTYDWIDLTSEQFQIPSNTVYRFYPCNVSLTGNTAEGGTAAMADRDVLLRDLDVQRGNTGAFHPFTIDNVTGGCGPRTYSMSISGPDAGDYSLDVTDGTLMSGESFSPTLSFTPSALGVRNATLTISDDNYFTRSFSLAGIGSPRIAWIPNMADGATSGVRDGDTLFDGVIVIRGTSRDFEPITLHNVNENSEAEPAAVTVTLDSAGAPSTQYELIGPTSTALAAGEEYTPVIRFIGEGVGPQEATLRIDADGEVRTYLLRAISGAPAIAVKANGATVDAQNPAMNLMTTCVGDAAATVPFVVSNTGTLPLSINDIDFYLTDTTYQQGTPMLPLLRDARGRPVAMADYSISDAPGGPEVALPLSVEPGQARQLYLSFVGAEPGKRFGRLFIRTNAENLYGQDTNAYDNTTTFPTMVLGLFTTDMTARSVGSHLSADGSGLKIGSVVFPHTHLGDTAVMSFTVANNGACDLRINKAKLRIFSGDVNEFRVLTSMRAAAFDAAKGDFVLAPGQTDTITVRFTPSRAGTRMATLWIQTNDSTIVRPGLAERGAYYVDLHGRGLAGLDGGDVVLNPVVIGGSVSGTAVLENTQTTAVGVQSIALVGGDAAEFAPMNWPATPTTVLPGSKLQLGVVLTPTGSAGVRRTTIVLVTTNGDTVRIAVRGEAGTQTLTVSPSSMFENTQVIVGQSRRQMLMIANQGTLPVRIASVRLIGPDSASYRLGQLPRFDLEAGQTEYLEVTYSPTAIGQTSAQIEVMGMNGQVYQVLLGGEAVKIRIDPVEPPTTTAPFELPEPELAPRTNAGSHPTLR